MIITDNPSLVNPDIDLDEFFKLIDKITEPLGLNVPQIVEIEKLRTLPIGTLGRTLADFMDSEQLTPISTGARRKQLDDSVHLLTGYGIDAIGEAEVQAFLLGAKFGLVNVILGLGLLGMIRKQMAISHPDYSVEQMQKRLWSAYYRGKKSRFDVDTWQPELQWHLPLTQVRDEFKL